MIVVQLGLNPLSDLPKKLGPTCTNYFFFEKINGTDRMLMNSPIFILMT
jgi:hypothetical protein